MIFGYGSEVEEKMQNNMGESTVYFDPSMLEQLQNSGKKKSTLVIVDNNGIQE